MTISLSELLKPAKTRVNQTQNKPKSVSRLQTSAYFDYIFFRQFDILNVRRKNVVILLLNYIIYIDNQLRTAVKEIISYIFTRSTETTHFLSRSSVNTAPQASMSPSAISKRTGMLVVSFSIIISGLMPSTEFTGPHMPRSVI